jgi:ADP-heptose:LPS heptosyltransferase
MIEKVEYWWRHRFVYPLLRLIFRNPRKDSPIDIQTIKSLLILRYDRIGDMIVTTPIFRNLKKANPALKIGVFASETNAEIIRCNPYVDIIYVLHSNLLKLFVEILKARKYKYEIVLNMIFNRTTTGGILANIISPSGIKIGQGDDKYKFYFNRIIPLQRDSQRMVDTLSLLIKESVNLQVPVTELGYDIFIDDTSRSNVNSFLKTNRLNPRQVKDSHYQAFIVFNLSASDRWTRFSVEQVMTIAAMLGEMNDFVTVITYAPNDLEMKFAAEKAKNNSHCMIFPEKGDATLLELAALVEGAYCVITPDTSLVHFASAMGTPVIGFYSSAKEKNEWMPFQVRHNVCFSENKLPVSSLASSVMIKTINDFLLEIEL